MQGIKAVQYNVSRAEFPLTENTRTVSLLYVELENSNTIALTYFNEMEDYYYYYY